MRTERPPSRRTAVRFSPVALALLATVVLLTAPVGTSQTELSGSGDGGTVVGQRSTRLLEQEENPEWAAGMLLIPIVLTTVPFMVEGRPRRVLVALAATLLWALVLLGLLSIGAFYLPSAVAMLVAAVAETRAKDGPAPR